MKTVSREIVLDQAPWLVVENHTVQLPTGEVVPDWAWVITPPYVTIAAITLEGFFLCFRQEKYAADGISLATVGGYLEKGESPLDAAQRELREETGYEAHQWTHLGSYPVDANRGSGTGHLFLARDAKRVVEPVSDDLEEQDLVLLTRQEVVSALKRGEFKIMSWAATIGLALAWLDA